MNLLDVGMNINLNKLEMKNILKTGIVLYLSLIVSACNNKSKIMEQNPTDKTTLIVTSSPNLNEMEELKKYVQGVMPLLLNLGGTVIKRSKLTNKYHGKQSFVFLLVMDFPSKEKLTEMFDSDTYKALIPSRNKGFTDIIILYAEDLE